MEGLYALFLGRKKTKFAAFSLEDYSLLRFVIMLIFRGVDKIIWGFLYDQVTEVSALLSCVITSDLLDISISLSLSLGFQERKPRTSPKTWGRKSYCNKEERGLGNQKDDDGDGGKEAQEQKKDRRKVKRNHTKKVRIKSEQLGEKEATRKRRWCERHMEISLELSSLKNYHRREKGRKIAWRRRTRWQG